MVRASWSRAEGALDMREAKQIYAAVEETVEKLGPNLFVSVANAGVTQVKPLLECTPESVSPALRMPSESNGIPKVH